ncbi:hypothetical protein FS842_006724 [Serendipita sp. 407]|nr:hypothetical protein FS842_006724 [Serendipita sp. 407]
MAAADQAILDQIQKLSGVLRQARDTDPTRSQSGSSSNHGPYQYSYRGRGRYQYPKFAPSRPLTTSKNVEIGGEVFKASSNKLTRQVTPAGSSTPVASSASAPVQPTSQSRAQRFASRASWSKASQYVPHPEQSSTEERKSGKAMSILFKNRHMQPGRLPINSGNMLIISLSNTQSGIALCTLPEQRAL